VDLNALWPQIVEAVGRASPFIRTYLPEAHPVSFEKSVLTIGFDPEFSGHLGLVSNPKNQTLFQTKLKELGFRDAQVKFIESEAPSHWKRQAPETEPSFDDATPAADPAPAAPADSGLAAAPPQELAPAAKSALAAPAPPPPAPEEIPPLDMGEFKNDPLIKKALETFRGQIVDIRQ
jgi:hypothetical protein